MSSTVAMLRSVGLRRTTELMGSNRLSRRSDPAADVSCTEKMIPTAVKV